MTAGTQLRELSGVRPGRSEVPLWLLLDPPASTHTELIADGRWLALAASGTLDAGAFATLHLPSFAEHDATRLVGCVPGPVAARHAAAQGDDRRRVWERILLGCAADDAEVYGLLLEIFGTDGRAGSPRDRLVGSLDEAVWQPPGRLRSRWQELVVRRMICAPQLTRALSSYARTYTDRIEWLLDRPRRDVRSDVHVPSLRATINTMFAGNSGLLPDTWQVRRARARLLHVGCGPQLRDARALLGDDVERWQAALTVTSGQSTWASQLSAEITAAAASLAP